MHYFYTCSKGLFFFLHDSVCLYIADKFEMIVKQLVSIIKFYQESRCKIKIETTDGDECHAQIKIRMEATSHISIKIKIQIDIVMKATLHDPCKIKYKLDIVMKATPQTMLHIQPRRNRKAVRNCKNATHVFEKMTFCFVMFLKRIVLPHSTVNPAMNVPANRK